MPIFYPPTLHNGREPTDDGTAVSEVIDGRLDTSHDFTGATDSLSHNVARADGSAQDISAVYVYTDNGVAMPVSLTETGGTVTPDSITEFESFRFLQREYRLWFAELTGRAQSVLSHFTKETTSVTAKVYQVSILSEPFLTIPNDNTFQRIDLNDSQRGSVIHESIRGKRTVVPGVNPSAKRQVAYRTRYQDKQLALDLKGILEQYPHFFLEEDRENFPERCYEAYMEDFSIEYTYSNTYRGSGFDTQFIIVER